MYLQHPLLQISGEKSTTTAALIQWATVTD